MLAAPEETSMKTISFIAILCAGGCGVDPMSDLDQDTSAVTVRSGVDYSDARPSPATLVADGYTFVVRYLSHDSEKNLTHAEAQALIAAGLDVVSNWEAGAENALGGYAQGVADAQDANAQATADGAPPTRPIYFSVDFDASAAQQGTLNDYFNGVASVIGRARTGAYAGFSQIGRLFDAGEITWGWQAYAWSYGNWDSRAQMRQIQNNIDGGCCDLDHGIAADFGQWGHGTGTDVNEYAFQANTTSLWTVGNAGNRDWSLGMMPGTSPSITALATGGYEVAFQANTGNLWTVGTAGNKDWGLGMMAGSSPSIAALAGGGFEVAFQANTTALWTVGDAGDKNWGLGMMKGTNPSISALPTGGYEAIFQANTTSLWQAGDAGTGPLNLGMNSTSSPSGT
jgi:hypothetical protein